jgi:hypothetical protein
MFPVNRSLKISVKKEIYSWEEKMRTYSKEGLQGSEARLNIINFPPSMAFRTPYTAKSDKSGLSPPMNGVPFDLMVFSQKLISS